jgi:peptidoglycan/xylan/chitin deacetylase (PgdA/CDA1 family)
LAKHQVRATFFVLGVQVAGHEQILQRMHRDGHEIGNHSWNHKDFSTLTPEEVEAQVLMTQQAIASAGVPVPKVLRPPYGAVNDMVVAHNYLSIVRWNVDPQDWKLHDPARISEHLLAGARPGAIILMHDIYPWSAAALDLSIGELKKHYQLVTASQLLNLSPGDQGQYFSR